VVPLGCCTKALEHAGAFSYSSRFTYESTGKRVDLRGLEPLASAMRGRGNSLLEVAGACKIPANAYLLPKMLCSSFQEIYSGCCTVAAHSLRLNLVW
jgi:hypothetical protein